MKKELLMKKQYCECCAKEVNTSIKEVKEAYQVKDIEIVIQSQIRFCVQCNTDLWDDGLDDENLKKAYQKYRDLKGLLQPEEIKAIRLKYNLTQAAFSKILGFGEKTITRYENGALQDVAQNNLILLIKDPKNFNKLWQKNKHLLSKQEIEKYESLSLSDTIKLNPQIIQCAKNNHISWPFPNKFNTIYSNQIYQAN